MKYLILLVLLIAVPAYPFDLQMSLSVEGRVKSQFVSRQINVLPDGAGRTLHEYGYEVKSLKGYTSIDHNFVNTPMVSDLQVVLVPPDSTFTGLDLSLTSKFEEHILYRMEGPDVDELESRRVRMNVEYAEIESTIDFTSGERHFAAVGEGRFQMQGAGFHIDPILCEVTAMRIVGRGLFNFNDDDTVTTFSTDPDPVPISLTLKSRLCPWVDRDGGQSSGFG